MTVEYCSRNLEADSQQFLPHEWCFPQTQARFCGTIIRSSGKVHALFGSMWPPLCCACFRLRTVWGGVSVGLPNVLNHCPLISWILLLPMWLLICFVVAKSDSVLFFLMPFTMGYGDLLRFPNRSLELRSLILVLNLFFFCRQESMLLLCILWTWMVAKAFESADVYLFPFGPFENLY